MKTETTTTERPLDNSIVTLLQNHRGGGLMDEASEGLRVITKAVHATGKKGKLVIEITVAPINQGKSQAVAVLDTVTVKAPQFARDMGIFFVTDEGELSRNDPRQRELPLSAVERDNKNIDHIPQATARAV